MKNLRWWIIAFCFIGLFSSLSYWQFQRGEQKEVLIARYQQTLTNKQAISIQQAIQRDEAIAWVAVKGRFIDSPPVLLDNQRNEDRVGVRVYRVFETFEREVFLVDLGWLPVSADRQFPVIPQYTNSALQGLWMNPPSAGIAMGPALAHQSTHVLATRMEMPEIAKLLNLPLQARILRLGPDADVGFERTLDILPNTLPPEKHRGYAVQWAGLAIAVFIIALVLQLRKRKSDEFNA